MTQNGDHSNHCPKCGGFLENGTTCRNDKKCGYVKPEMSEAAKARRREIEQILAGNGDGMTDYMRAVIEDPRLSKNGKRIALAMMPDPTEWQYTGEFYDSRKDLPENCECGHPIRFQFMVERPRDGQKITIGSTCIEETVPVLIDYGASGLGEELRKAHEQVKEIIAQEQKERYQNTQANKLEEANGDLDDFNIWRDTEMVRLESEEGRRGRFPRALVSQARLHERSSDGHTLGATARKYGDQFGELLENPDLSVPPFPESERLRQELQKVVDKKLARFDLERQSAERTLERTRVVDGLEPEAAAEKLRELNGGLTPLEALRQAQQLKAEQKAAEERSRLAEAKHRRALEVNNALAENDDHRGWGPIPKGGSISAPHRVSVPEGTDETSLRRMIASPDYHQATNTVRGELTPELNRFVLEHGDVQLQSAWARSPIRTAGELDQAFTGKSSGAAQFVLQRSDHTESHAVAGAHHASPLIRKQAVQSPLLPVKELEARVHDDDRDVVAAVAARMDRVPATSSAHSALVNHDDVFIRRSYVAHAPKQYAEKLKDDEDVYVAQQATRRLESLQYAEEAEKRRAAAAAPAPATTTTPAKKQGIQMASKFPGKCRDCGGGIAIGDSIYWEKKGQRGKKTAHAQCPEA